MSGDELLLILAEVEGLVECALRDRLERDLLLAALGRAGAALPLHRAPDDQLRSDLLRLAQAPSTDPTAHPLLRWLEAAEHMSNARGSAHAAGYAEIAARVEARLRCGRGREVEPPAGQRSTWVRPVGVALLALSGFGVVWWLGQTRSAGPAADASLAADLDSAPTVVDAGAPVPIDAAPPPRDAGARDAAAPPDRSIRPPRRARLRIFTEEDARVEVIALSDRRSVFVGRARFGSPSDPAFVDTALAPGRYRAICDPGRGEGIDRAEFELSASRLEIDCRTGGPP